MMLIQTSFNSLASVIEMMGEVGGDTSSPDCSVSELHPEETTLSPLQFLGPVSLWKTEQL